VYFTISFSSDKQRTGLLVGLELPIVSGVLSFWGCEPRRDGTCFPCGMFLHCASNADHLYVNAKQSLAANAASPLAVG
jgi:hypothetical protein